MGVGMEMAIFGFMVIAIKGMGRVKVIFQKKYKRDTKCIGV
jgi:Na+-transporting methylmalonyl-CoA/oxaloacetate decarboxylase gamma subunit